jgi:hypothetical protein
MRPESWSALYDAQLSRYQTIFDADHNMDAKAGVVLGALLAVSVFVLNRSLFSTNNKFAFSLLIIGCLVYVVAIISSLYILNPRFYATPANTTKDRPDYLTKQDDELMYQLIVDVEYAAEQIEVKLRRKAAILNVATLLFILGTFALLGVKLTI